MKNKIFKKITIILISLAIISGLSRVSLAENEENVNNEDTNTTNTTSTTTTTNTTQSVNTKSSNANLKDLGIKPHDFTGFKYGTTTYNVTVPEDTKTVEVYAKAQDSKAKITGAGKKTLDNQKTSVDVVVTAEDGTTKTYTINITKGEKDNSQNKNSNTQNTTNEDKSSVEENKQGLASLKIKEINLTPSFATDVYEYNIKYTGKNTKLDIEAEPTNSEYKVEIVGNKDLVEGENIITILVEDKEAKNIATYQIVVDKNSIEEQDTNKDNGENKLIMATAIAIIIAIIIIFFFIKKRKNNQYIEDYYEEDDEEEDDDNYYDYEEDEGIEEKEELPKALRNKIQNTKKEDDEEISKENARKNFLDEYNNNDYKEEKGTNRGKRFK